MRAWRAPLVVLLVLAPLAGCLASTVMDESARAPAAAEQDIVWRAGTREDVPGLYSSLAIEGGAAAVLHEVHYWFASDGSFTGAALVRAPELTYMVLNGRWRFTDGLLLLSEDGLPARLEASAELLRLTSEEGVLVLARRPAP